MDREKSGATSEKNTFVITRHGHSCNNLKAGKSSFSVMDRAQEFDPGLSIYGILTTLLKTSKIDSLDTEDTRYKSSEVFVSPLIRTWLTGLLLYLPNLQKGKELDLHVSPYLIEKYTKLDSNLRNVANFFHPKHEGDIEQEINRHGHFWTGDDNRRPFTYEESNSIEFENGMFNAGSTIDGGNLPSDVGQQIISLYHFFDVIRGINNSVIKQIEDKVVYSKLQVKFIPYYNEWYKYHLYKFAIGEQTQEEKEIFQEITDNLQVGKFEKKEGDGDWTNIENWTYDENKKITIKEVIKKYLPVMKAAAEFRKKSVENEKREKEIESMIKGGNYWAKEAKIAQKRDALKESKKKETTLASSMYSTAEMVMSGRGKEPEGEVEPEMNFYESYIEDFVNNFMKAYSILIKLGGLNSAAKNLMFPYFTKVIMPIMYECKEKYKKKMFDAWRNTFEREKKHSNNYQKIIEEIAGAGKEEIKNKISDLDSMTEPKINYTSDELKKSSLNLMRIEESGTYFGNWSKHTKSQTQREIHVSMITTLERKGDDGMWKEIKKRNEFTEEKMKIVGNNTLSPELDNFNNKRPGSGLWCTSTTFFSWRRAAGTPSRRPSGPWTRWFTLAFSFRRNPNSTLGECRTFSA